MLWQFYENAVREREERRYNEHVEVVVNGITERLDKYKMILRGGAGLFSASEDVTRGEWRAYYEYQQAITLYPGIQGIAFSRAVLPCELAQHIEEIRAEGFPAYTIRPAGDRELFTPVVFIEPFDDQNRSVFGYDLFSEPKYRAAMERARDTGKVAISENVRLATATGQDSQPKFLMVTPIYTKDMPLNTPEERRAANEGYVLGVFRLHELMQGIFSASIHAIDLVLYDGADPLPEAVIYHSHASTDAIDGDHRPIFTSQKTLDLYGHQWTMIFATTPAFEMAVDRYTPRGILAAGLLISFLIFFYLKALETTGDRALALAQKMTAALREGEHRAKRQRAAIAQLVLDDIVVTGEIAAALRKINEVLSSTIGVERSSIWILDASSEELQCLSLYDANSGKHSSGTVLQAKNIPRYFAAILEESMISAENARKDPRTSELTEGYLKPLGIAAMLDAGIVVDGKLKGVICLEHVGGPRRWHVDEEAFISTIASMAAQVFIIAERKQLAKALQQSEEKYRFLTENIIDVIWTVDLEGRLTYVSPAIGKMLGYTPEEIMAMPIYEHIVREDHDAIMARLAEELARPPAERIDYLSVQARCKAKDNRLVYVEFKATWMRDERGDHIGVQGSTRDITERKQLEEQLLDSKRMYQSVVDTQQEMICRYLPDTTLTFVNDAYCKAFGKSRRELLGRKYLEFISPELQEREIKQINSLTLGGPSKTQEYRVLLPDGSTRWQEWTDYALFTEFKEIKEIQGVGRDITELKLAEEETCRHSNRAGALLRAASRLNAELELKPVLHAVCEEVCAALHAALSIFLFYDSKNRAFYLAADTGLPPEFAKQMGPLSRESYDELLQRKGKFGVIPDLSSGPDLPYAELLREYGIKRCAYAVMEREGSLMGMLIVGVTAEEVAFPEDAAHLLLGLTNQAASAVANARLYAEAQERLRQVQALRNIDMAITGSLDLRVTFQVVLDEVTSMLNTDAAAILRLDPHTGTLRYEYWRGFRTKDFSSILIPLGEGYGGRIALKRQSIHIPDLSEIDPDPLQGPLITSEGFASYYAVPLIAKGSVLGVLEVFHREPLNSNGDWLTFLETLAGQAVIAIDNAELLSRLERSNVDLLRAYDTTIEGWARALDLKDGVTEDHSRRVAAMTLRIAGVMGLQEEELAHVRRGALLHDIGKMGIPDKILLKDGKLTNEEWEVMRKHPLHAFEMLSPIGYLRPALDIPYHHHEKWDGSGYPRGLIGEQIPLAARIFAVVDVFDALTSERPYRPAWTREQALGHIRKESGKHFDPQVVEVFLKLIKKGPVN